MQPQTYAQFLNVSAEQQPFAGPVIPPAVANGSLLQSAKPLGVPLSPTSAGPQVQYVGSGAGHRVEKLFGKRLSVITLESRSYLIGVKVASLLKRETFNMYRSMKIKNIEIQRASAQQVEYLAKVGAVRNGTHSVTLIPYDEALYFIADARDKVTRFPRKSSGTRKRRSGFKSFMAERPKLHRRKPHPWNIHRSVRKDEQCAQLVSFEQYAQHLLAKQSESAFQALQEVGKRVSAPSSPKTAPSSPKGFVESSIGGTTPKRAHSSAPSSPKTFTEPALVATSSPMILSPPSSTVSAPGLSQTVVTSVPISIIHDPRTFVVNSQQTVSAIFPDAFMTTFPSRQVEIFSFDRQQLALLATASQVIGSYRALPSAIGAC